MKIFLIGWFGAGNMGDEAILLSDLLWLREKIHGAEFYILSFDPERTRRLTEKIPEVRRILKMGSKANAIRSDFMGILKAFRKVDLVLIGGGGIFQDIYNRYPIPFFTAMALLAKWNRKTLLLYCVGIGPIRTWLGRRLCRLAANTANMVSVRDSESRALLKEIGVTKEIVLSADPVFLLKPQKNEVVEELCHKYRLDGHRPLVGVCVQELFLWDNETRKGLAEVLDTLIAEKGAGIVFLPLGVYRDGWLRKKGLDSVDMAASKRLAELMTGEYILVADELSPQNLLAVIQKMDLMVSMRLHGLIMGLSMGVPAVALTYREEIKIKNLMRRLDQKDRLFEVGMLDKEKLLHKLTELLDRLSDAKRELEGPVESLRAEAERCNDLFQRTFMDGLSAEDYKKHLSAVR